VKIEAPDYILAIPAYVPGKPVEELERERGICGSIKLASNENPIGPSPKALEALRQALASVHRYPDSAGFVLTGSSRRDWGWSRGRSFSERFR